MEIMKTSITSFDTKKDLVELSSDWPKWKRAFEFYIETKSITEPKQKCAFLMHAGGMGLQDIFASLPRDVDECTDNNGEENTGDNGETNDEPTTKEDDYSKAISKLDTYFCMKRNTTIERFKFRKIKQLSEEPIEQFARRLRAQLNRCDFGPQSDEYMRDQIIEGTSSEKLREKALLENSISLTELLELGQSLEAAKLNIQNLESGKLIISDSINHLSSEQFSKNSQNKRRHYNSNTTFNKKPRFENGDKRCFRCGHEDHLSYDEICPARKKICERCNKIGHYRKMCRTNLNKQQHSQTKKSMPVRNIEDVEDVKGNTVALQGEEASAYNEYLFHIGLSNQASAKYECLLGGVKLKLIIDSGSEVNVLDLKTWETLKENKIEVLKCRKGSNKNLRGYGSQKPLTIIGEFTSKLKSSKKEVEATFYVVREIGCALLGRITSSELGILYVGDVHKIEETIGKIKNVVVDIPIDENVTPVSQPYRRIPIPLEEKVNEKLKDLMDQVSGIIYEYVYYFLCFVVCLFVHSILLIIYL